MHLELQSWCPLTSEFDEAKHPGHIQLPLAASLIVSLGPLNVITCPNGSGKSNVYRASRLLADTANGGVVRVISAARRDQLDAVAGPATQRKAPVVALRLDFHADEFSYVIDLGSSKPNDGSTAAVAKIVRRGIKFGR